MRDYVSLLTKILTSYLREYYKYTTEDTEGEDGIAHWYDNHKKIVNEIV